VKPRIAVPFWDEKYLGAYATAIHREGAEVLPVPLRNAGPVAAALTRAHGLMLIGGGDIAPDRFGRQDPGRLSSHVEPQRDELEIAALKHALERDLPVLGICRGLQVLAVAHAGVLHLDIPTEVPTALDHAQGVAELDAHSVTITPGSRLAAIMGQTEMWVNSRHHQAVRNSDCGTKLVATARAPDGLVEALEAPERRFVVSVQWHPEEFVDRGDRFAALFQAFLQATITT
jgi:putative glutamine amidotransferase